MLVRRMIKPSPARWWLNAVLERGLLRALILITLRCNPRGWKLQHQVGYFLRLFLPAGLVYFHAVVAYGKALEDAQALLLGDVLKKNPLYGPCHWEEFFACADERLEVLTEYQSSSLQKACDNTECGLIRDSTSLRRCSGCQVFYYCSVECQRNDWEIGHRNACPNHHSVLLSERAALTFCERSFFRALIHDTYLKERPSICVQQIRVLSEYDSAMHIPLLTLFDYCRPLPTISVEPVDPDDAEAQEQLRELVDTESAEWQYILERARLGEGRYQLHAIRVVHGMQETWLKTRSWVVPLRTDGDAIFAGLRSLAQRMRQGSLVEEDLMGEIDLLLQAEAGIVVIH
ncbi:hypothetical protein FB45DRAFT_938154 [Roridomyces roridus]|uniref:MYND-type domain-containing protein n=1 Tax=Roridomyces roridus TaxID=1738132 RepID=A0AAD7B932_9AGAR|nr:hypothetical protein FB45DRAFT_938154 [Roridomyces roridus]